MDCIIVEDDEVAAKALTGLIEKTNWLKISAVCHTADEALKALEANENIELIFLDVELPDMSGIDFLRNFDVRQQVIMVTTHSGYAADAFDFNVTDFLIKPLDYARFLKAIQRFKDFNESIRVSRRVNSREEIYIKISSRLRRLEEKDILYVEALADYVTIYMADGKKHVVLATMKSLEMKLNAAEFARIHRSYIIRLDRIIEIEEQNVAMEGKNLPISRTYQEAFYAKLNLI